MSDPIKEQQKTMLQAQVDLAIAGKEDQLRRIMFLSALNKAQIASNVSTGFLITAGATASLLLPNLASLDAIIPTRVSLIFLYAILASSCLGLLQKLCAIAAVSSAESLEEITEKFGKVFEAFESTAKDAQTLASKAGVSVSIWKRNSPIAVFEPVLTELPWPVNWFTRRAMQRAEHDSLYPIKRGMRYLRICFYTGITQMTIFIVGFVYVLVNVRIP
jgi:hypothetical protein